MCARRGVNAGKGAGATVAFLMVHAEVTLKTDSGNIGKHFIRILCAVTARSEGGCMTGYGRGVKEDCGVRLCCLDTVGWSNALRSRTEACENNLSLAAARSAVDATGRFAALPVAAR